MPRSLIFVAVVSLVASPALSSDWPTYRGSFSRVGWSTDDLSPPLNLQWELSSPQPPQRAWPGPGGKTIEELNLRHRVRFDDVFDCIIVGSNVYFGSSVENCVDCVDLHTGIRHWRFFTDGPVRLAPTHSDGRLYAGSDDGHAYCLDAESGSLIWKHHAGPRDERILARRRMSSRWPVRTGVLVDDGVAYFGAGTFPHETVYVCALRADTGEIVWRNDSVSQQDAGRNDLTPQGHLLASDDLLFVSSGRTLPAAFDRESGRLVHKQLGGGKQIGGSAALLTSDLLYSVGEHEVVALGQRTGEERFRLPGRQIALANGMAYVATGEQLHAVDHQQYATSYGDEATNQEFENRRQALRQHPYILARKRIDVIETRLAAGEGDLERLRNDLAATRKKMQQQVADYDAQRLATEGFIGVKWRVVCPHDASLIVAGNLLVAGGRGQVQAFDTESGELIWEAEVDGEARGLAAANGHLVVSTTTGKIYCFAPADSAGTAPVQAEADAPFEKDPRYAAAARAIIDQTGITRGYCLIVGSETGQLAYELAQQSGLKLYCVEQDREKVARSRRALAAAGLYGWKVTVEHVDSEDYPLPNYFANLIVSDTLLVTGKMPARPESVARHLKPCGGMICLGVPPAFESTPKAAYTDEWLTAVSLLTKNTEVNSGDEWSTLTRGKLPGAGEWTHQYGNPGSTSMIDDTRLRGGLSVLWYGDPGPSEMLNRHVGAVGPISTNGRLIQQGDETLMAYDAYNGQFLWEIDNAGAIRTGVFNNYEPGNLAASDAHVFHVVDDECWQIDAATGDIQVRHKIPSTDPGLQWGFLAHSDGKLFGTTTRRRMLREDRRRRGIPTRSVSSDTVFAIDIETGAHLWSYKGKNISHTTVALGDGRVFFVDSSLSQQERQQLLDEDKSKLRDLTGEARELAEERLKRMDARMAVALDADTGERIWAKSVDVTDCSDIGIGGGKLTLIYHDGHLVFGGANANGHYWEQFLAGDFKQRRLVTLSAADGYKLWSKDANYRHRPIIIGNQIIAEPWAFDLSTGEQITRIHPVTGVESPWKFIRPGHHCGALTATPSMVFFRSKYTGYYDLESDSGTRHFAGHRMGCWVNAIPANGLLLIPEASAGCACLFSLTATVAFEPRERSNVWGVYTAEGMTTPVQHLALNLGGPGDRRDHLGRLWLGYPRPTSRPGLDLPLNLEEQFAEGGRFFADNSESTPIKMAEVPWVCASGAADLRSCSLPLVSAGQAAETYQVKLLFAAADSGAGEIDIHIQDATRRVALSGDPERAQVVEFTSVRVEDKLNLALASVQGDDLPTLCGIEVKRAD